MDCVNHEIPVMPIYTICKFYFSKYILDSGRRANSEEKVHTNKCPFLNGYRDRAV